MTWDTNQMYESALILPWLTLQFGNRELEARFLRWFNRGQAHYDAIYNGFVFCVHSLLLYSSIQQFYFGHHVTLLCLLAVLICAASIYAALRHFSWYCQWREPLLLATRAVRVYCYMISRYSLQVVLTPTQAVSAGLWIKLVLINSYAVLLWINGVFTRTRFIVHLPVQLAIVALVANDNHAYCNKLEQHGVVDGKLKSGVDAISNVVDSILDYFCMVRFGSPAIVREDSTVPCRSLFLFMQLSFALLCCSVLIWVLEIRDRMAFIKHIQGPVPLYRRYMAMQTACNAFTVLVITIFVICSLWNIIV